MLREYGVYPQLERIEVPGEAGDLDVPRYVDCYIQDAERRAEGYPEDMGGGRFASGDHRYAFQVLMWLLRSKRIHWHPVPPGLPHLYRTSVQSRYSREILRSLHRSR